MGNVTKGFVGIVLLAAGCQAEADRRVEATATQSAAEPAPLLAEVEAESVNPRLLRRFKAVEASTTAALDATAALGKKLFMDPRLSRDGNLSCNSCHDLGSYGVDGAKHSVGVGGKVGSRNAPTVYHAFASFSQFWDGRAASLEDQAKGPILNPSEMAASEADVAATLAKASDYDEPFAKAFPQEPNTKDLKHVALAIAAFERTLVTTSRWDRFLLGDSRALTLQEHRGLKVFINSGCMVCHTGVNLGGSSFERVGVVVPWPNAEDQGRMQVTGAEADRMVFKVPTLRNVERTAPYFHDGSAESLEDAVRRMGRHQLGIEFSDREVGDVVAWLGSLTGELPASVR